MRAWVENGLKAGQLKAVVCTSSLDLGVDFLPVEQVLQIGSAKGVGRLVQRAGRSGHAPGRTSSITLVPTHSLELVEAAAARHALAQGRIEDRHTPRAPLDVLVQHLVTVALGGGFVAEELLAEVRRAPAYATLADNDWQWALQFVRQGGASLAIYPDYRDFPPSQQVSLIFLESWQSFFFLKNGIRSVRCNATWNRLHIYRRPCCTWFSVRAQIRTA